MVPETVSLEFCSLLTLVSGDSRFIPERFASRQTRAGPNNVEKNQGLVEKPKPFDRESLLKLRRSIEAVACRDPERNGQGTSHRDKVLHFTATRGRTRCKSPN